MSRDCRSNAARKAPPSSQDISHERLLSKFLYDPESGAFYWRSKGLESKAVGYVNYDGYIRMYALGRRFYAHRLAWFYVTGRWPNEEIDHINGVRSDNRIKNLRCVSRKENCENSGLHDERVRSIRPKYIRR